MLILGFAENSIQLVPDGTLFLHILIILTMVYVLNITLFKPINKILENRDQRTRGRAQEASDILRQVEEKLAHYEQSLRETRVEGYRLLEQERAAALRARQDQLSAMREEIDRSIKEHKEQIHAQAERARVDLGRDARRIAYEISARILNRPIEGAPPSDGGV
jgi:F-type H+-transporting ATPase subunit b